MKWTFASACIVLLGIFGTGTIFLFQDITVDNENDYYLLKEITEASMYDAIDLAYYRLDGKVKINQERFVESFTRRFARSSKLSGQGYVVEIVDVIEDPPKVTVRIKNGIKGYTLETDDLDIVNELSAIIETNK